MIVHDVMLICPHCQQETGIGTVALFDRLFKALKKCEKCGRDIAIINDDYQGILAQVGREQRKLEFPQEQELHSSRLSVHLLQFLINDDSQGILAQVGREQRKLEFPQEQELHSSRLSVHLLQFRKRHRFRTVRNGACTMCLEIKRLLEDERAAWIKFRHDRHSKASSDAEIVRAHENAFAASLKLRDHLAKCPNCQGESDKRASQGSGG